METSSLMMEKEAKSSLKGYIELTKPRITVMALISAAIGYACGQKFNPVPIGYMPMLHLLVGLSFIGAASNTLNQAYEVNLDKSMNRTLDRPIPSGRVSLKNGYLFGIGCFVIGMVYLLVFSSLQVAFLAFLTIFSYVLVYTPLKTRTSLNTVAGAFPGAFPVLTGWCAGFGDMHFNGLLIFFIVFVWQLPHFFSISWIYKEDYKNGGYKMMSLYDETGWQAVFLILLGTVSLVPVSILPYVYQMASDFYFFTAILCNCFFLASGLLLLINRNKFMKQYFYASIIYLPVLLLVLMLDILGVQL